MSVTLLCCDATNAVMRRARARPDLSPEDVSMDVVKRVMIAARYLKCTHLICGFDSRESWRWQLTHAYKEAAPQDTHVYTEDAYHRWRALGLACVGARGFEGDDVVATLAFRSASALRTVYTLSSDNDLLQLVPFAHVMQYAPLGAPAWLVERDEGYVHERFGVRAEQYPAYLALVGGKNDVAGVPGVGPKRAAQLLSKHDTLSKVLAELWVQGKVTLEARDQAVLAERLLTLSVSVPVPPITNCRVPIITGL